MGQLHQIRSRSWALAERVYADAVAARRATTPIDDEAAFEAAFDAERIAGTLVGYIKHFLR